MTTNLSTQRRVTKNGCVFISGIPSFGDENLITGIDLLSTPAKGTKLAARMTQTDEG